MDTEGQALQTGELPTFNPDLERRKVAYHEAAHAVLGWNLGFGVIHIVVDRKRFCGKVQPRRGPKNRFERVADAVTMVAGLAAHSYVEPTMTWKDICCSLVDLSRAAPLYAVNSALTDGEQLGLGLALTRKVVVLIEAPEVRKQIESLTKPLLRDGRMFQAQIHARLEQHPATPAAKRRCREFVREVEAQHDEILARVAGFAPEFRWPNYPG
jgi:hypothetical protein